ncbi:MAG: alkaline phosphatase family protein [Candidatus Sulfotelmatobacter sp.]
MGRIRLAAVGGLFGFCLLSILAGCGGSSGTTTVITPPPTPSYTLGATALNPATVTAGNTATSTVTVTPANGYTGSVNLSCSVIATSAPTCSFSPSTVKISGTTAGASTLTVSTATSLGGGPYNVTVQASDTNNLGPSNGSQTLPLVMTAVIQHVVIIFQENRTPDNLFQGLCLPPNSASACSSTPSSTQYNIQNFGIDSTGATVPLVPLDLGTSGANPLLYDLSHAHNAFTSMCDLDTTTNTCKMDGADLIVQNCEGASSPCGPQPPQFVYVTPADVAPYLQMAQTYTFGDQMFQTNEGPSYPAHQFILGGTSEPWVGSGLFVSENPAYVTGTTAGCIAQSTTTVKAIDASGVETAAGSNMYLCTEHETLTDEMDAANPPVSWRYYAPSAGSIWTAPTAIEHMCGVGTAGPGGGTNGLSCTGPDYVPAAGQPIKVVTNEGTQTGAQVLSDISSGNLQQVSWVIPAGQFSDHAFSNTGCGPSWVTSIVNAIGASPYWANTVIIITWDDWGGWYDHVPPPKIIDDGTSWGSGYVYGFRVPIMVISPYIAKSGYISHNTHDFGSILRYMEGTFSLPSLGFADAYALDDLSDFFNLSQTPIGFTTITPPSDDSTCQGDASAPTDPDDD